VTRGQLNNLGLVMLGEKRYDEAERLFRESIAMSPSYAGPHYNLRRMYMELGRYDEADRELWIALDKGLRDPKNSLNRAARDYEGLNLLERAEAILKEAIERYPEHEPFWVHLQVIKIRRGRYDEARDLGAEVVRRFPGSAPAYSFYAVAAVGSGDVELARRVIRRALELNPDQPDLRQTLAELEAAEPAGPASGGGMQ
jgi:tetratricopeptide (TPR) repeat protein